MAGQRSMTSGMPRPFSTRSDEPLEVGRIEAPCAGQADARKEARLRVAADRLLAHGQLLSDLGRAEERAPVAHVLGQCGPCPVISSEGNRQNRAVATAKTGDISPHRGLLLSLAMVQMGPGLRFDVDYCGRPIGWIRLEYFAWGPRMTKAHMPGQPHEGVDWNALEQLGVDELLRMQDEGADPKDKNARRDRRRTDRAIMRAFGFGKVSRSGTGRQGRPSNPDSVVAVRARAALAATHETGAHRYAIEQGRDRCLVRDQKLTPAAEEILARVDGATDRLLALLDCRGPVPIDREDYARGLMPPFRGAEVDAAIWQLVADERVEAIEATEEVRRLSGALYQRIEPR
jgi:hypothetical protein